LTLQTHSAIKSNSTPYLPAVLVLQETPYRAFEPPDGISCQISITSSMILIFIATYNGWSYDPLQCVCMGRYKTKEAQSSYSVSPRRATVINLWKSCDLYDVIGRAKVVTVNFFTNLN
jgi:hypothetical protein